MSAPAVPEAPPTAKPPRQGWLDKLKAGLRKTGNSLASVFTGTQIDDALYEFLRFRARNEHRWINSERESMEGDLTKDILHRLARAQPLQGKVYLQ